jgi:predicted glycosyltransferase
MRQPRLLFQSHNRRGLGHLMRGLNLARAIRRQAPSADILFYARSASAESLCGREFRACIDTDAGGTSGWPDVVRTFAPDVVVYDTLLPSDPAQEPAAPGARRVYVMRKVKAEKQAAIFANAFLDHVDLVLIPHIRAEFGHTLSPALHAKSAFVGPIVRLPEVASQDRLRAKYGIQPADFVLTSTVGGGGFTQQAEAFFAAVYAVQRELQPRLPRLRHLVIQGPHFGRPLPALPGLTVVEFEPDLIDLLALSDLVLAEGGYNTVNEIRVAKTPAVFLPSSRNLDDQEERVRALEAQGLAAVCTEGDAVALAEQVAARCLAPDWLSEVQRRYAVDQVQTGNQAAAERILELVGR